MLAIHKKIVLDESQKPFAVQIPIEEFEQIESLIENYGLAKLMDEVNNDDRLSGEAAINYYRSIRDNVES